MSLISPKFLFFVGVIFMVCVFSVRGKAIVDKNEETVEDAGKPDKNGKKYKN